MIDYSIELSLSTEHNANNLGGPIVADDVCATTGAHTHIRIDSV